MQIISLYQWTSIDTKFQLFTYTDGEGKYPITNDGSVFFFDNMNHLVKDLLKNSPIYIPHSESKNKEIFEINKIISIYDTNFNVILKNINDIGNIYFICDTTSLIRREFENFKF